MRPWLSSGNDSLPAACLPPRRPDLDVLLVITAQHILERIVTHLRLSLSSSLPMRFPLTRAKYLFIGNCGERKGRERPSVSRFVFTPWCTRCVAGTERAGKAVGEPLRAFTPWCTRCVVAGVGHGREWRTIHSTSFPGSFISRREMKEPGNEVAIHCGGELPNEPEKGGGGGRGWTNGKGERTTMTLHSGISNDSQAP